MADQTPRTFNHFARVALADAYWTRTPAARRRLLAGWLEALGDASDALHVYQLFGVEGDADLLLWSACASADTTVPAGFFAGFGAALRDARRFVRVRTTLWGFTRPSPYTKVRSTQELDPFAPARAPYLVMYPFTKTDAWYQLPAEERRRMMQGHIQVGKRYKDITQLLLYSTGLQDQEFVVVYETADLPRFSALVTDLRSTEARPFTLRDAPLHTAVYQPDVATLARWL